MCIRNAQTPGTSPPPSPEHGGRLRVQMGGIVITDELVERTRTQLRDAEAALRAKRDAQAHADADGDLARFAQALADLGRRATELRQVYPS